MMSRPNYHRWEVAHDELIARVYPEGGAEAVMEEIPELTRRAVMQRASQLGVRLRHHRGGKNWTTEAMRERMSVKPESPYPWEPDPLNIVAKHWGYITRRGQLRPMVRVELGEVA